MPRHYPSREPDTSPERIREIRERHVYYFTHPPYMQGYEAVMDLLARIEELETAQPAPERQTFLGIPMVPVDTLPQDGWALVSEPNPRTCPNCGGMSLHMTGLGYDECQSCGHRIGIPPRVKEEPDPTSR